MSLDSCLTALQRELLDRNILYLHGEVNEEMAEYVMAAITVLEVRDSPAIEIRIMSTGGHAEAGLFIAQRLQDYGGNTTARVYLGAKSAAVTILLMCDRRLCEKDAMILVHEGTHSLMDIPTFTLRSSAKMREIIDASLAQAEMIVRMYADKTGLPLGKMRKLMREDRDMSAQEALELGFIHEIF